MTLLHHRNAPPSIRGSSLPCMYVCVCVCIAKPSPVSQQLAGAGQGRRRLIDYRCTPKKCTYMVAVSSAAFKARLQLQY